MQPRRDRRPEALVLDPDVLRDGPVLEFQSELAVESHGGHVVLPWRDRFQAAEANGLSASAHARDLPDHAYHQVIVHLQKSRAATFDDLAQAWRILEPGGQLLLAGTNTLGIVSAVKKLGEQLDQTAIVVTNRAKARVVRFLKDDGPGPRTESTPTIEVSVGSIAREVSTFTIETAPGVFSARKLDTGSEILLDSLASFVGYKAPKRIVDLGCGTGLLGIAAAHLWPEAEILLADADARAVACAEKNIQRFELGDRCRVAWWDAREEPLDTRFQLALINPPFHHRGAEVDLGPALSLFTSLSGWLKPGGRALLVANQTLPYEAALEEVGALEILESQKGYKLLSLKRSARSGGVKGRKSPSSRSGGSVKLPIRSR